jgi:predicted N-acetyltransferase YhbS
MLRPFAPSDTQHAAAIWTAACGPDLAISPHLVEYNTRPATGAVQAGRIAMQDGQPTGFVLASALPASSHVLPSQLGWIDAVAVSPAFQRQGIGSALLTWAEAWLAEQGCTHARLGGSLRPFTPGLPVELDTGLFFDRRGYQGQAGGSVDWDVAHDLGEYEIPNAKYQTPALPTGGLWLRAGASVSNADIRAAQPGQEEAVLEFFNRSFPGRWQFEFLEFVREAGRMSDYMLLWTGRGVDGFARLTFEDSERPIERFHMRHLPRPWGQLGPIGVSDDCRGQGYGGALLDAGLRRLRECSVRGCVIDWTSLVDFYGKFGFKPYRQYAMLLKSLNH